MIEINVADITIRNNQQLLSEFSQSTFDAAWHWLAVEGVVLSQHLQVVKEAGAEIPRWSLGLRCSRSEAVGGRGRLPDSVTTSRRQKQRGHEEGKQ